MFFKNQNPKKTLEEKEIKISNKDRSVAVLCQGIWEPEAEGNSHTDLVLSLSLDVSFIMDFCINFFKILN